METYAGERASGVHQRDRNEGEDRPWLRRQRPAANAVGPGHCGGDLGRATAANAWTAVLIEAVSARVGSTAQSVRSDRLTVRFYARRLSSSPVDRHDLTRAARPGL